MYGTNGYVWEDNYCFVVDFYLHQLQYISVDLVMLCLVVRNKVSSLNGTLLSTENPSKISKAMQYFNDHPAYVVIYGMGGICLLLVVIAVVIILTAPSRGR